MSDFDLAYPPASHERKLHKLKKLVQAPNSYFMDVRCTTCLNVNTVFSHATSQVVCEGCGTVLGTSTGGKLKLAPGTSFRLKNFIIHTMQMRYDLLTCYASLLGMTIASTVLPIPVAIQMVIITGLIIYIASHQAAMTTRDPGDNTIGSEVERHSAYLFPIIGSCLLLGLYIIFKIFPRPMMVAIFKLHFIIAGIYVVAARVTLIVVGLCSEEHEQKIRSYKFDLYLTSLNNAIRPIARQITNGFILLKKIYAPFQPLVNGIVSTLQALKYTAIEIIDGKEAMEKARHADQAQSAYAGGANNGGDATSSSHPPSFSSVPSTNRDDILPASMTFDGVLAISYFAALTVAILYLITNHWVFNNIFAICFSLYAIELVNLGSSVNGLVLLCGLFFYDIFWVVGTDIMSTVAKSIDAPIKLVVPSASASSHPSILGLGDIVIPGAFLALMLRLDMTLNRPLKHRAQASIPLHRILGKIGSFSYITIATEYFNTTLIAYSVGLLVSAVITSVSNTPQPALLYLVPACILSVASVSILLGKDEFKFVVEFVDNPQVNEDLLASKKSKASLEQDGQQQPPSIKGGKA